MGHSRSSVVQEVLNETINSSLSKSVTSNQQEASVETLVETAATCSSSVNQSNSCNLSNMTVGGNLNIGGNQSNKASVNFSCVNSSTAAQAMENAAVSGIAGELTALNGTEAAAKLNAMASAANKSGALNTGGSSSSNVSSKTGNKVTNTTQSIVENLYKSNISQHLTSKTVDECIGKTSQSNSISAEGTKVAGSANAECNQSNSLEQVQECKQLTEALQKSFKKTAQELGFSVKAQNTTSSETKMEGKAEAKLEATGIVQDLGNAVSGVIGSVGNLFGMASLGVAAPFVVVSCAVFCCIILSCVSSMMAKSGGGGSGGQSMSMPRGRTRGFRGGYSDTEGSDTIEYLGALGVNILSDVVSDSSVLFD
jgi:hypothetical protein